MTTSNKLNLIKISLSLACISFAGCTAINTKIATANFEVPDSVFIDSSFSNDPGDYLKFLEKIKPFSRNLTMDKVAEWYVDVDEENALICAIGAKFNQLTKLSLNKGSGLLQPVYLMSENGVIEPDWKKTEQLRDVLISKFKLDISGMSESKKYHEKLVRHLGVLGDEQMEKTINNIFQPITLGSAIVDLSNTGNKIDSILDDSAKLAPDFVNKNVLNGMVKKPSYLIETSQIFNQAFMNKYTPDYDVLYHRMMGDFAKKYPNTKIDSKKMAENLRLMKEANLVMSYNMLKSSAMLLSLYSFVKFTPLEYYDNIKKAGLSMDVSGFMCNLSSIKNTINIRSNLNNNTGFSAISYAISENSKTVAEKRIDASRVIIDAIKEKAMLDSNFINRVATALAAFKVSGRIKSAGIGEGVDDETGVKNTPAEIVSKKTSSDGAVKKKSINKTSSARQSQP